jgi:DNA-binding response OmpR family regulator
VANRILVVEDQEDILDVILTYLRQEGYLCQGCQDGLAASQLLKESSFDLLVLDWMLPGKDGLSLCKEVRARTPAMPILVVSARGQDQDRMAGLESGADDYLPKPFHPRELVARVRALLRRSAPTAKPRGQFGELSVNFEARQVFYRGQSIGFSATELSLFLTLASRPEATWSRQELLDQAWGSEFPGSERTVDSHMRSVRARLVSAQLNLAVIESVWGVGYRFNPSALDEARPLG